MVSYIYPLRKKKEIYARKRDSKYALSFLKNRILRAIRRIKEIMLIAHITVFDTQSNGKKATNSTELSFEVLRKTPKTSLIHPTKHIKQRDKKRKKLLFFNKFLDFLVDSLSVKSAFLTKTGGMIMKKKKNKYEIAGEFYDELSESIRQIKNDIYSGRIGIPHICLRGNGRRRWEYRTWNKYPLAYDCKDCLEFEKCWEIKGFRAQLKRINTILKSIRLKRYKPRQLTLEERNIDDAHWKEIDNYAQETALSFDEILKCLRKRNTLEKLFEQGKLEQDYSYFSTIPTD